MTKISHYDCAFTQTVSLFPEKCSNCVLQHANLLQSFSVLAASGHFYSEQTYFDLCNSFNLRGF